MTPFELLSEWFAVSKAHMYAGALAFMFSTTRKNQITRVTKFRTPCANDTAAIVEYFA